MKNIANLNLFRILETSSISQYVQIRRHIVTIDPKVLILKKQNQPNKISTQNNKLQLRGFNLVNDKLKSSQETVSSLFKTTLNPNNFLTILFVASC
jgi:hypothetical protein